jgi:hypothetical protein
VERSNKGEQAEQHWQQPRHAASGKAVESDQNGLQPERQARLSSPIPQGGETERHITRSPTKAAYTSSRARSPRWLRLSLAIPVTAVWQAIRAGNFRFSALVAVFCVRESREISCLLHLKAPVAQRIEHQTSNL